MKAFSVQINGEKHCLAGVPRGGMEISIGLTGKHADDAYTITVYGVDIATEDVWLWPSAELKVGDDIQISLVEADHTDAPEELQHGRKDR